MLDLEQFIADCRAALAEDASPRAVALGSFIRAGGAAKCLTLRLDEKPLAREWAAA